MPRVRFTAGFISQAQADEMNRIASLAEQTTDQVARLVMPTRDEFPAQLTDIEPDTLRTAWSEMEYDRFGQLVEKPVAAGGRSGTFEQSPAFPMSGSGPTSFPVTGVRLRRRIVAVEEVESEEEEEEEEDEPEVRSLGPVYEYDWVDADAVEILQVQFGESNTFGYPARVQIWSAETGDLIDLGTTEVRVKDFNGGTFEGGDYVNVTKYLGRNTGGVDCYSGAELTGGGSPTLEVVTDAAGSTIAGTSANPSVTTTTAMLVLPTSGIWQLTLNMYYTSSTAAFLTYNLREMTGGGLPPGGSLAFFGPGANSAGDSATWTFNKALTTAERWTVVTYVTATEDNCQIGFDSSSLAAGVHQDNFLSGGGATHAMSLTGLRVGDAPP